MNQTTLGARIQGTVTEAWEMARTRARVVMA